MINNLRATLDPFWRIGQVLQQLIKILNQGKLASLNNDIGGHVREVKNILHDGFLFFKSIQVDFMLSVDRKQKKNILSI
jgi:hypothetical protein